MNSTRKFSLVLVLAAALGLSQIGATCSSAQKNAVIDASLSLAQIACAMTSNITGEDQMMQLCNIPESLRPLLQQLLVGKRAGMSGHPMSSDAGHD